MEAEQEPQMVEVLVTRGFGGIYFALLRGMEEISISGMDLESGKMYIINKKDFDIDTEKGEWIYKSKNNQSSRNIDEPVNVKSFFLSINPQNFKPRSLPKPEQEFGEEERDEKITEWYQDSISTDDSVIPVGEFMLPSFPNDSVQPVTNFDFTEAKLNQTSKTISCYFIGNCKLQSAGLTKEENKLCFRFRCWNDVIVQDMFLFCSLSPSNSERKMLLPFVTISTGDGNKPQFNLVLDKKGRPVERSCVIYCNAVKSKKVTLYIKNMISGRIPNPTLLDKPFADIADDIISVDANTLANARKIASENGYSWQSRYFIFPMSPQFDNPLNNIRVEICPKVGPDRKPTDTSQSVVYISKKGGEEIKITNGPLDSNLPMIVKLWENFFFFTEPWSNTFQDNLDSLEQ